MPKTSVENNFQKQVKANAEKELNNLQEQAGLILRDKIANFDYILMLVRLVSRLVKKTESDKAETKTADKIVKPEAIDEDYVPSTPAPASDIRVDDDKAVDKEYLTLVLNKIFLAVIKEATILYDVKSSSKLEPFIRELGGKPMMCKSGHSFMKSKLLETGALLEGEMSDHIFIKDRWYGFDDGLFVTAQILEILSIDLRKSRQIFAKLPDALNTPEILIATPDAHGIIEKLDPNNAHFNGGNVITIDGVRVEYTDGWWLVRASNISDNLTMRFEADNEKALQRIANSFKAALMEVEPGLEFPF